MDINIRENILTEMFRICEEEHLNSKIFRIKNSVSNQRKKIREEYLQFLNSFLSSMSIYRLENKLGFSEKSQKKEMENKILCFKGTFRSFLKNIEKRYPEKIWGIKK